MYKDIINKIEDLGYIFMGNTIEDKDGNLVGLFNINFNKITLEAMDKNGNFYEVDTNNINWPTFFKNIIESDSIDATEEIKLTSILKRIKLK